MYNNLNLSPHTGQCRLKYPDQLAKVIEVNVLEKLAITIDFEKISPQQVFLGLSAAEGHTEPPRTLVFTCKSRSCKLELVKPFSPTPSPFGCII